MVCIWDGSGEDCPGTGAAELPVTWLGGAGGAAAAAMPGSMAGPGPDIPAGAGGAVRDCANANEPPAINVAATRARRIQFERMRCSCVGCVGTPQHNADVACEFHAKKKGARLLPRPAAMLEWLTSRSLAVQV
jgi:hypothetical protein